MLLSDQDENAERAASTASLTSSTSPTGTEPISFSVEGLTTSMTPSPLAGTHLPSMYMQSRSCMEWPSKGRLITFMEFNNDDLLRESCPLELIGRMAESR